MSFNNQSLGLSAGRERRIGYAVAEKQGWRESMEDFYTLEASLENHPDISMFGVFDGHSSWETSSFLSKNLYKELDKLEILDPKTVRDKILSLDELFNNKYKTQSIGGSTMTFVIIKSNPSFPYTVDVYNCGDSRCFKYDAQTGTFKFLSFDHKPDNEHEKARILRAGGEVVKSGSCYRVDFELNMSRAFGDYKYKQNKDIPYSEQKIIALCDVQQTVVHKGDYLFLTCDGIFNKTTPERVFDFISNEINSKLPGPISAFDLARKLIGMAEANKSSDNMTVVCLMFLFAISKPKESVLWPCGLMEGKESAKFIYEYFKMGHKYNVKKMDMIKISLKNWVDKQIEEYYKLEYETEERKQKKKELIKEVWALEYYLNCDSRYYNNLEIRKIRRLFTPFFKMLEELD